MVCLDVVQVCVLETVGWCVFRRGSVVCVLETVCCGVFRRGSGVCVGNGGLLCV